MYGNRGTLLGGCSYRQGIGVMKDTPPPCFGNASLMQEKFADVRFWLQELPKSLCGLPLGFCV